MSESRVIRVFGTSIEVMISSLSSNHTLCVCIETTPPGGGPPPHRHDREEEVFTVLDGQFDFYQDGVWTPMGVGMPRLSPRGVYHAFRNVGPTAGRMMFMTNGGGIDDYFQAVSELHLPEQADRLAEISRCHGYFFLEPTDR